MLTGAERLYASTPANALTFSHSFLLPPKYRWRCFWFCCCFVFLPTRPTSAESWTLPQEGTHPSIPHPSGANCNLHLLPHPTPFFKHQAKGSRTGHRRPNFGQATTTPRSSSAMVGGKAWAPEPRVLGKPALWQLSGKVLSFSSIATSFFSFFPSSARAHTNTHAQPCSRNLPA